MQNIRTYVEYMYVHQYQLMMYRLRTYGTLAALQLIGNKGLLIVLRAETAVN